MMKWWVLNFQTGSYTADSSQNFIVQCNLIVDHFVLCILSVLLYPINESTIFPETTELKN